jgi:hypothetical protein
MKVLCHLPANIGHARGLPPPETPLFRAAVFGEDVDPGKIILTEDRSAPAVTKGMKDCADAPAMPGVTRRRFGTQRGGSAEQL